MLGLILTKQEFSGAVVGSVRVVLPALPIATVAVPTLFRVTMASTCVATLGTLIVAHVATSGRVPIVGKAKRKPAANATKRTLPTVFDHSRLVWAMEWVRTTSFDAVGAASLDTIAAVFLETICVHRGIVAGRERTALQ